MLAVCGLHPGVEGVVALSESLLSSINTGSMVVLRPWSSAGRTVEAVGREEVGVVLGEGASSTPSDALKGGV